MPTISDSPRTHEGEILGARRRDTIVLTTAPGEWYLNATIDVQEARGDSGARIVAEPVAHAAGDLTFQVSWWHSAFGGKVRYQLNAQTEAIPAGTPAPRTKKDSVSGRTRSSFWPWIARGSETLKVTLPAGFRFKSAALVVKKSAFFSSASIASQPPAGSTGELAFQVNWRVALGTLSYTLEVTSEG